MAIELRGARYRYAGATGPALDGIDLAIEPGRVTGIVGANESGKSTLCLVASGLAPAAIGGQLDGSVLIDGAETRSLRPHEVAQRCGILFQNPTTQLSGTASTVWEEVAFGPRNLGLPLDEVMERVAAAMATARVGDLAARDPARLSGGQAQLVALAAVLALRPAYLVLDEPTSQLDPFGTRLVGAALANIARESGTGILIVEHKTDLLALVADDVVLLERGRVLVAGPAAATLADPRLAEAGVTPPAAVTVERAITGSGAPADRRVDAALDAVRREVAEVTLAAGEGTP